MNEWSNLLSGLIGGILGALIGAVLGPWIQVWASNWNDRRKEKILAQSLRDNLIMELKQNQDIAGSFRLQKALSYRQFRQEVYNASASAFHLLQEPFRSEIADIYNCIARYADTYQGFINRPEGTKMPGIDSDLLNQAAQIDDKIRLCINKDPS